MGPMVNWTIKSLQADLKTRTLASEEIYRQCLLRIQKLRHFNAFVTVTEALGLEQARKADSGRKPSTPRSLDAVSMDAVKVRSTVRSLDGIPIAVKDNFCVRNVPATCGSRMLADFKPSYTATVVQRLFDAGATLVGKTNLDEFGMGSGCVDSLHGATKNAWNSDCVAGGSSGGSAVAVATGCAVAALGSDTGGSTRNPASYNGVVGLKPTYGLVSRHGLIPLVNSMDVPGIMARNVDDATAILNIVAGWDENDSTTVKRVVKPVHLSQNPSVRNVRIGLPREYFTDALDEQVVSVWKEVANIVADSGAVVKEVSLPYTQHSIACYSVLNQCEVASNMARYDGLEFGLRGDSNESTEQLYAQSRSLGLGAVVRRRILCGNYFLLAANYDAYFMKAMQVRRLISQDFEHVWDSGVDVLLTPVTLSDAPTLVEFLSQDARAQSASQDYCTQPANMAGIPAVSLPVGLSSRRLPLSLQVMAPNFQEDLLLNVAKFIEERVKFSCSPNLSYF